MHYETWNRDALWAWFATLCLLGGLLGGYNWRELAENIALGQTSGNGVVRDWLQSMSIEEMPALDQKQLAACAAGYGRPSVRHLARYFLTKKPSP